MTSLELQDICNNRKNPLFISLDKEVSNVITLILQSEYKYVNVLDYNGNIIGSMDKKDIFDNIKGYLLSNDCKELEILLSSPLSSVETWISSSIKLEGYLSLYQVIPYFTLKQTCEVSFPDKAFVYLNRFDILENIRDNDELSFILEETIEDLVLGDSFFNPISVENTTLTVLETLILMDRMDITSIPFMNTFKGNTNVIILSFENIISYILKDSSLLSSKVQYFIENHYIDENYITCEENTKMNDLINLFTKYKQEYCWVLDSNRIPVSVIHISEIITRIQTLEYQSNLPLLSCIGNDGVKTLLRSKILVCGANRLGIEIVSILSKYYVNTITIHDCNIVTNNDIKSQKYLSQSDIGTNRAISSAKGIKKYYPKTNFTAFTEDITEEVIKHFNIVIFTSTDASSIDTLNLLCRKNGILFISCNIRGLSGYIFNDFGNHCVLSDDMSLAGTAIIDIKENGIVEYGYYSNFHPIKGMNIIFHDVKGNQVGEEFKIKETFGDRKFLVDIEIPLSKEYTSGLVFGFKEVKKPILMDFKAKKECSIDDIDNNVFIWNNRNIELFYGYQLMDEFFNKFKRYPNILQEIEELYCSFFKLVDSDETNEIYKSFQQLFHAPYHISIPMASIFGGLVAQEVIKGITKLGIPFKQYYFLNFFECIPEELMNSIPDESSDYYDSNLFGEKVIKDFGNKNILVTSSKTSLAKLFLSNLEQTGAGSGNLGKLTVIDNNNSFIDNSNIHGVQYKLEENQLDECFWNQFDIICGVNDKLKRKIVIDECVHYCIKLVEGNTLGSLVYTNNLIPYESASIDCESNQFIGDLKAISFPFDIEHCIQWAIDRFYAQFTQIPTYLLKDNKSFEDRNYILDNFGRICKTFMDCIKWARELFDKSFTTSIVSLLETYPEDYFSTTTDKLFWKPPKKCPHPIFFDIENEEHLQFVLSASLLRARVFGIEYPENIFFKEILMKLISKAFQLSDIPLHTSLFNLSGRLYYNWNITIQKYNGMDNELHYQFVKSAANIRADNYNIEKLDRIQMKIKSCKVKPESPSSISLCAGLMHIELYKHILYDNLSTKVFPFESFRNSNCNPILCMFNFFEVERVKFAEDDLNIAEHEIAYPPKHTIWDKIPIHINRNSCTLKMFIDLMEKQHNLSVDCVCIYKTTGKLIYATFGRFLQRLDRNLMDIIKEITGISFEKTCELVVVCSRGEYEVTTPNILLYLDENVDNDNTFSINFNNTIDQPT